MSHTITCKNCHTLVAKTPNQVCVKCGASKWGYETAELNSLLGIVDPTPIIHPPEPVKSTTSYKLVCKSCNKIVAKTPNKICVNCNSVNWGYSEFELANNIIKLSLDPPPIQTSKPKIRSSYLLIFLFAALLIGGFFVYKKYYSGLSEDEIFAKYSPNVVFVYHQYVYHVTFDGNEEASIDFVRTRSGSYWVYDKDSILPNEYYGCGLLISNSGRVKVNDDCIHPISASNADSLKEFVIKYFNIEGEVTITLKTVFLGIGYSKESITDTNQLARCVSEMGSENGNSYLRSVETKFPNELGSDSLLLPSSPVERINENGFCFYFNTGVFIGDSTKVLDLKFGKILFSTTNDGEISIGDSTSIPIDHGSPVFDEQGNFVGLLK